MVTLTAEQERAVDAIGSWLRDGTDQAFVLGGYAGTGKTTILRHVVEQLDPTPHCCAPTGKAAAVLESKLPDGVRVSTIHSLLYRPIEVTEETVARAQRDAEALLERARETPDLAGQLEEARARTRRLERMLEQGTCIFAGRAGGEQPVVVVDEASMVDERLEADLRAKVGKLLFVGDPGQLPPVEGRGFFERNQPDAVLEQVHRQAADSRVLRLATAIRRDEAFDDWDDEECRLVPGGIEARELLKADQVITGKNATRRWLNTIMRRERGHVAPVPEAGEPIMCLRNKHNLGLVNGVGGQAASNAVEAGSSVRLDLAYCGSLLKDLYADPFHFRVYGDPRLDRRIMRPRGVQLDWGYAITVHKAQGSEWDYVVGWNDGMRMSRTERTRWIYTAVTRAKRRLTWVNASR